MILNYRANKRFRLCLKDTTLAIDFARGRIIAETVLELDQLVTLLADVRVQFAKNEVGRIELDKQKAEMVLASIRAEKKRAKAYD